MLGFSKVVLLGLSNICCDKHVALHEPWGFFRSVECNHWEELIFNCHLWFHLILGFVCQLGFVNRRRDNFDLLLKIEATVAQSKALTDRKSFTLLLYADLVAALPGEVRRQVRTA